MREYFDKENGIVWIDYFSTEVAGKPAKFTDYIKSKLLKKKADNISPTREDIPSTMETLDEFDNWSTSEKGQGIRDYVMLSKKNKMGMGSYFFQKYLKPDREIPLEHEGKTFHLLTAFGADQSGSVIDKSPLGTILLSHEDFNAVYRDYIEYIVVNPERQGRGIGGTMLDSMSTKLSFFTGDPTSQTLATYIKKGNTTSKRLFASAGFRKYQTPYIEGMTDDIYNSQYESYIKDDFTMTKTNKSKTL